MLYLIGLGLNKESITYDAMNAIKNCRKVYLENYTVNLPYSVSDIQNIIQKKIIPAEREFVESNEIVKQSKHQNIVLLVYGSPLVATTHISLIHEAKKMKVPFRIISNASILDAIVETGLQVYKFGKIASIPAWKKNYKPTSFAEIIKQNQKINAHTLVLIDIDLGFQETLKQLEESSKEHKIKLDKIIVCSKLGTKTQKILYEDFKKFKKIKEIEKPYCLIIPGKLHFLENKTLNSF